VEEHMIIYTASSSEEENSQIIYDYNAAFGDIYISEAISKEKLFFNLNSKYNGF
jgi:hypothetical protein